MPIESVLIPDERKATLIGRGGRTKLMLERATGTALHIRDTVEIEGGPLETLLCRNIVTAIGRGFPPRDALLLLDEDYGLDVISLRGETRNSEKRLMARVIGSRGTAKKIIEHESGAKLCIYGKTVSAIGTAEQLALAKEAVELLLKGKTHKYVFKRMRGARGVV